MSDDHLETRGKTFLAGKVIFNFGQSSIDCIVRRISEGGATVELESVLDIPDSFQLSIPSEEKVLACRLKWRSDRQIGATFEAGRAPDKQSAERNGDQILRSQTLALRAAFEHEPQGL